MLQALLGTVDTWFAGQLNDTAIAAIGATTLIVNLFLAFYTAISVGTSAVISRFVGEKNYEKANLAAGQSVLLSLFLGLFVGIVAFLFQDQILTICGAENAVLVAAKPYYRIVAVPSVFVCLTLVLSSCLRASKDTVTPMIVSGASNILNIILDALFLHMGFGIAGLALATTMARIMSSLALFLKLFQKNSQKDIAFDEVDTLTSQISTNINKSSTQSVFLTLDCFAPNRDLLCTITKISIPAGIERLIMRGGQLIYNGFIFSISTNAYVAHQVAGTIEYYSYIPAFGFSAAASTLVGISLGEKNTQKAKEITWKTWLCANAIMIPIGLIFFFASPMLSVQFTNTAEVQSTVVQVLRLIAFFQPVIAFSNVFAGALQGAGDTKYPMYATFFGTWVVHIGLGYLLGVKLGLGLFGIWIGYALNNAVRSVLLYIRFKSERWSSIDL